MATKKKETPIEVKAPSETLETITPETPVSDSLPSPEIISEMVQDLTKANLLTGLYGGQLSEIIEALASGNPERAVRLLESNILGAKQYGAAVQSLADVAQQFIVAARESSEQIQHAKSEFAEALELVRLEMAELLNEKNATLEAIWAELQKRASVTPVDTTREAYERIAKLEEQINKPAEANTDYAALLEQYKADADKLRLELEESQKQREAEHQQYQADLEKTNNEFVAFKRNYNSNYDDFAKIMREVQDDVSALKANKNQFKTALDTITGEAK
jgi:DNA repair exonuclease SbcCD ATPase subunit